MVRVFHEADVATLGPRKGPGSNCCQDGNGRDRQGIRSEHPLPCALNEELNSTMMTLMGLLLPKTGKL